ncbi:MAG: hypothetical protein JKY98_06290 [Gammaproteobacteria bacterium]|nr:hypothetical protein [Gammaproteobacteria bacterium]
MSKKGTCSQKQQPFQGISYPQGVQGLVKSILRQSAYDLLFSKAAFSGQQVANKNENRE